MSVIDAGTIAPHRPRSRVRSAPRAGFVTTPIDTAPVAEWAVLADRTAGDNVFAHPDFALPAARAIGRGVQTAAVNDREGLAALVPFTATRLGRIAPAARVWTHPYAPLGLPLVDSTNIGTTTVALLNGLAGRGSLIVPDLPLDEPVARMLLGAARVEKRPVEVLGEHVRAIFDRPADADLDVRALLGAKKRKEYGRQLRRLGDLGTVSITYAASPDAVATAFEIFLVLEAGGWKGRKGTALVSEPHVAEFARKAVAARAAAGAVRIASIAVDHRPVAMVVCFISGKTAFTWKIAYDETYARFSPGAQLMLEIAPRLFAESGVERIDSCATPDHPMIDHLWDGRMRVGTVVIGPRGGSLLHSAGLMAEKAERTARELARRTLRG